LFRAVNHTNNKSCDEGYLSTPKFISVYLSASRTFLEVNRNMLFSTFVLIFVTVVDKVLATEF